MTNPADIALEGAAANTAFWLERHGPALRRYFRRRVDPADIDDLVQDVMVRLQTAAIKSDVAGAERYLFTVARHALVDRHRTAHSSDLRAFEAYARIDGATDRLSPERILLAREEYARVRRAMLNLPPRARAALEFHRFENMTYDEIATTMRITRDAVKKLIHRALTTITTNVAEAEAGDD